MGSFTRWKLYASEYLLPAETEGSWFRFFDVKEAAVVLDPAGRSRVSQEDVEHQKDLFYV